MIKETFSNIRRAGYAIVLRHEVAQVIVTTKPLGCNRMFRHPYPTRACVIGKTILRNANGVRSLWNNVPAPIWVDTRT